MTSILLAEDSETIRNMYAFALQHEGFAVTITASGAETLDRVQQQEQPYDVILLDMLMPGMSGLDFLREYDVRVHCPQTKVIALTNFDSPKIVEEARELGVVTYLNKSKCEPQQLSEYIRQVLAGQEVAP